VLNWVRGTANILKIKDNIRINCVMPGIVATNIIPPEMVAAVKPEFLTPVKTITDAYVKLLDDRTLYGQAIEGSVDKHLFFPDPPMMNGAATKRAITVWDPLYEMIHGELSGLPDAIPGKSFPKA
jgi:NAD(P)-dependent dehydrogenase (short-subunit alcohol dehydrogenase family)